jgi:isoaspartyl peptidase/L-asparaginase-like protein (Ntn-hydrolase superfamily)
MTNRVDYALAIHGGAGVNPSRDYGVVEAHLSTLIAQGETRLRAGESALDVVEAMVNLLELSGHYVAGRGSAPNSAGRYELDAAIMDGAVMRAGAVAALSDICSPINAARCVLEKTAHILLAGEGAQAFCATHKIETVTDPARWYTVPVGVESEEMVQSELSHGTVGAVALDRQGRLAAATSTGGLFGKLAGRVGDTPLIGSGTWADGHLAVSCTGLGEYFILTGAAKDVADRVRYGGSSLADAARATLAEIAALGGDGGLIAVDRFGEITMPFNSGGMKRASVRAGEPPKISIR